MKGKNVPKESDEGDDGVDTCGYCHSHLEASLCFAKVDVINCLVSEDSCYAG